MVIGNLGEDFGLKFFSLFSFFYLQDFIVFFILELTSYCHERMNTHNGRICKHLYDFQLSIT